MAMVKMILFLVLSFFIQAALGGIICELLPMQLCSYSVSSSGKRCLLENFSAADGTVSYQCKTSEVVVDVIRDMIETEECISACGVDRNSVGISSDSLVQPQFSAKLCSDSCYHNCPNIVDLYFNLALGEGVYLPSLCDSQRTNPRRAMSDIQSSGVAWGPASAKNSQVAWGPSSSSDSSGEDCAPVSSPTEPWVRAPSPMGSGEAWGRASSSSDSSGEDCAPVSSPTEPWVPAPSPMGSGEAWGRASSSSDSSGEDCAPVSSPTEPWAPAPSPMGSGEAWGLASSSSDSSSEDCAPVSSPTEPWAPAPSPMGSGEAWGLASSSSVSSGEDCAPPVPSPTEAWVPAPSPSFSGEDCAPAPTWGPNPMTPGLAPVAGGW